MDKEKSIRWIGYCGAYCKSCIFFNKIISEESKFLEYLIAWVNLNKWYKPFSFKWEEAEKFMKEMKEGKFNCESCRINPNWKDCPVYLCAKEKNLAGCWECESFPCEKLKNVWKNHPEYLAKFVRTVREQGIEKWVERMENLYKEGKDFLGRRVYRREI